MQEPMQTTQTESGDWLSALFDGELEDHGHTPGLGHVARDEALKARWSEYCMIGDAMRGQAQIPGGLPDKVRAALAQEPTVLAPNHKPLRQQPALWLAAAATVTAVTWMVLKAAPSEQSPVQMAARPAGAQMASVDVAPYLAVHQDYAQALTSTPEMHFSQVALAMPGATR